MSFSNEMKDFFSAFSATSAVAGRIQDRKLRREELAAKKKDEFPYEDWLREFPGVTPTTLSDETSEYKDDEETAEAPVDEEAAIEVAPVMEPKRNKVYGPAGMTAHYAAGGRIRTGTQKGRLPVDMSKMNKDLLNRWAKTQKDFGREFNVVSAYRSPKRNKKAGGAKKSQHMHGNAIDIDVSGLSKPERLKLIQTASANGMTGIGVYNNSLHFDVGGRRAWGPDYSSKSMPGWAKDTIGQHLAGKFGAGAKPSEGTRSGSAVAGTRGGAKIPAALPVEPRPETRIASAPEQPEPSEWDADEESALPLDAMASLGDTEEEQDTSALDAFYSNEGIDVGAIDVPEPRPYRAVNLTAAPQPAFAEGGTVPWAGETSYVGRGAGGAGGAGGPMGSYYQRRPYPSSQPATKGRGKGHWGRDDDDDDDDGNKWNRNSGGNTSRYASQYQSVYNPRRNTGGVLGDIANGPLSSIMMLYGMEDGGAVPGEPEEETAIHEEEIAATTPAPATPAPAIPERPAPPVTSAGNAPKKPVSLGQAIDLGLKHLTGALGLDRSSAAVGPDKDLNNRRRALIRGDIGANEPPPNPKEMEQIFKTVDPSGKLDDSLRTIYAMRKGVEFYMTRGQPDKAAKWAAGLIQYSNLVSRQYGIEAVKAGRAGDMEGMVQLAVKSYDAIPDGMSVQAKLIGGKEVSITRTDEEGNVIDTHRLTPQQVFQMATGISTGSGYFDALMEVADPTGKKGGGSGQKGAVRAANLSKLLPDLKDDLEPGELEAWEDAAETGDDKTLNDIIKLVQGRRKERAKDAEYDEREAARDRRIEAARKASEAALDKRLAASEENLNTRLTAQEEAQAKRDAARDKRDEETRRLEVESMVDLYPDYEADMSPSQKKLWENGVKTNNPKSLERILKQVDDDRKVARSDANFEKRLKASEEALATRIAAQEESLGRRLTAQEAAAAKRAQDQDDRAAEKERKKNEATTKTTEADLEILNAMYQDIEGKMTSGEKNAWALAIKNKRPATIRDIIRKYNKVDETMALLEKHNRGGEEESGGWFDWLWGSDEEEAPVEEAIPTAPAPAVTPESNAGRPMPPEIKAKAMQAIRDGRSRAGVIEKLRKQGYDPAGL
jgi:hypothetical protein